MHAALAGLVAGCQAALDTGGHLEGSAGTLTQRLAAGGWRGAHWTPWLASGGAHVDPSAH
jgi:hypothetical protein